MRLQKKRENYVERQSVDILSQLSPRQRNSDATAKDLRSTSPQHSPFRGYFALGCNITLYQNIAYQLKIISRSKKHAH